MPETESVDVRVLKKYPNRRLYDTRTSVYVTLEDVRGFIIGREKIQVLDSRTQKDITRNVLLQIISEQEEEGHEPLLTNRVLENLVRFYGQPGQAFLGRYIEHSLAAFLEQQRRYQQNMQRVLDQSPVRLMREFADQNTAFWRSVMAGQDPTRPPSAPPGKPPSENS